MQTRHLNPEGTYLRVWVLTAVSTKLLGCHSVEFHGWVPTYSKNVLLPFCMQTLITSRLPPSKSLVILSSFTNDPSTHATYVACSTQRIAKQVTSYVMSIFYSNRPQRAFIAAKKAYRTTKRRYNQRHDPTTSRHQLDTTTMLSTLHWNKSNDVAYNVRRSRRPCYLWRRYEAVWFTGPRVRNQLRKRILVSCVVLCVVLGCGPWDGLLARSESYRVSVCVFSTLNNVAPQQRFGLLRHRKNTVLYVNMGKHFVKATWYIQHINLADPRIKSFIQDYYYYYYYLYLLYIRYSLVCPPDKPYP